MCSFFNVREKAILTEEPPAPSRSLLLSLWHCRDEYMLVKKIGIQWIMKSIQNSLSQRFLRISSKSVPQTWYHRSSYICGVHCATLDCWILFCNTLAVHSALCSVPAICLASFSFRERMHKTHLQMTADMHCKHSYQFGPIIP